MAYAHTVGGVRYTFDSLAQLLARATSARSGDQLAGICAASAQERVAAQMALADLPLKRFLDEAVVPYETDDVTRLILDTHEPAAFAPIAGFTVGDLRDWLLADDATGERLAALAPGLTPEMAAAVSKLMRLQDLVLAARKISVVTRFRTTVGLPGRLSTRLQPNHPTDDPAGIAAAIIDGLMLGSGDAVIGINPVSDSLRSVVDLLHLIDRARQRFAIPTQSCVLAHVTTQMEAMRMGAPVDLVFQSIGGTEATNRSFGVSIAMLDEANQMARELKRRECDVLRNGPRQCALRQCASRSRPADARGSRLRSRAPLQAYAVNTVVGFIGPEYLYDGKQILRAGLEDHFCGKLLGLPMGCDVCYTNHAEADQDDMDALLTMLGAAGVNYIMGVPGADDIMLNYQSTSFHDALYLRRALGLRAAPEFEAWLAQGKLLELSVSRLLGA
jgi:ethanolamine ammonia-lyase large subunit